MDHAIETLIQKLAIEKSEAFSNIKQRLQTRSTACTNPEVDPHIGNTKPFQPEIQRMKILPDSSLCRLHSVLLREKNKSKFKSA